MNHFHTTFISPKTQLENTRTHTLQYKTHRIKSTNGNSCVVPVPSTRYLRYAHR